MENLQDSEIGDICVRYGNVNDEMYDIQSFSHVAIKIIHPLDLQGILL